MEYRKIIIDIIKIVIGSLICALALNIFLNPAKISTGGASGVGMLLFHVYNFPISLTVLLINIPLFIIALKDVGLKFCIRAIIGTLLLVLMIELTGFVVNIEWLNFSSDLFLSSIFGGIFMGIGLSIVFKGGGSTGGSDLLAQIIYKKRSSSSIGQLILIIDATVILSTILVFKNVLYGLYSIVSLYLANKTIDIVFEGINYSKVINIITKKDDEIVDKIIEELDRGVTTSKCLGEYTNEEYIHIVTVVNKSQIPIVKKIVKQHDQKAFVYISPAIEVLGTGFKELR
ncbi:MAG: YitT family protein [Clostridia bacterium]|nr:YitT family protein [Clostridia bacterium]